ncbi:hypothetical protein ACJX0J_036779, partial [Zea mays]
MPHFSSIYLLDVVAFALQVLFDSIYISVFEIRDRYNKILIGPEFRVFGPDAGFEYYRHKWLLLMISIFGAQIFIFATELLHEPKRKFLLLRQQVILNVVFFHMHKYENKQEKELKKKYDGKIPRNEEQYWEANVFDMSYKK